MEDLPKLKQILEEKTSTSKAEPKPFIWDSIIFSIASAIVALSVSGLIVDFFRSDEYSLACYRNGTFKNRPQYTYINSYCHKHLPFADYFQVALVLHAVFLIVPHYLWKVSVSAQFDTFFSYATKIETLIEEDTGKYPLKNYSIANNLQREFGGDRKFIFIFYIAKLILQLLVVFILISMNIVLFADINTNITFQCSEDDEGSQLFDNVTCAYPKKLYINVLQVFDYILLGVAVMVLTFGVCWCLLYNHPLAADKIAKFCYESSIDAMHYEPSKNHLGWFQMKNDLGFLLASLSATNSGRGRIFKNVFVENINSRKFVVEKDIPNQNQVITLIMLTI